MTPGDDDSLSRKLTGTINDLMRIIHEGEQKNLELVQRYEFQVQRLIEIEEARQAREQALRIEIESLRVQAEHMRRQIAEFVARTNNT